MLFQAAAREISQKVVSAVTNVLDVVADKLQEGEEPVNIITTVMTAHVSKTNASALVKQPVRSHIGNLQITGQFDVPAGACVVSQVGLGPSRAGNANTSNSVHVRRLVCNIES